MLRLAAALLVAGCLAAPGARASNAPVKNWTGLSSQLWSDPHNWLGNVAPVNGDRLVFPLGGSQHTKNDMVNLELDSLQLDNSTIIDGNGVTLTGLSALDGNGFQVNVPLYLNTQFPQIRVHGNDVITGDVTIKGVANGSNFYIGGDPNGTLVINGSIHEQSPSSGYFALIDRLQVTGAIGLSLGYQFIGNQLHVTSEGLGHGSTETYVQAPELIIDADKDITQPFAIDMPPLTPGATSLIVNGNGAAPSVTGSMKIYRDVQVNSPLRIRGPFLGQDRLVVASPGVTLENPGNTAYTGDIEVKANGSLALQGDFSLPPGAVTIDNGGALVVGASMQEISSLACAGTLALTAGSPLHVTNSVSIAGCSLGLSLPVGGGSLTQGATLVANHGPAAVQGTFSGIPEHATLNIDGTARQISYVGGSGNDITLAGDPGINLQDMWWAGSAGNGWGMSVIQHGDTLFSVVFAYDSQGKPTWFVMPGGSWDSTHTIYQGPLYTPTGSPFFDYDLRALTVGNPDGSMDLQVMSPMSLLISYTIGGTSASQLLSRQPFGPDGAPRNGDRGDMWWGGASQNGWGIAILEQSPNIFPIWYTYDANGKATWYVVPVGSFSSPDVFNGRAFRTTSSPWLGTYDPSKLHSTDAGSFQLQFRGDTAQLSYIVDGFQGTAHLVREPF